MNPPGILYAGKIRRKRLKAGAFPEYIPVIIGTNFLMMQSDSPLASTIPVRQSENVELLTHGTGKISRAFSNKADLPFHS